MRRIITESNVEGRSFILKTEIVESMGLVWQVPPGEPMGREPEGSGTGLHFPDGALVRSFSIPPQDVMAEMFRRGVPGFDERGFHKTDSLDVIVLLEGDLILDLDEASIEMKPGDVVIQRGTNHAWRNLAKTDARCLAVTLKSAAAAAAA
jgi:quercetin dioxygenase-like cupin family protein